jgi:hypothetical protein
MMENTKMGQPTMMENQTALFARKVISLMIEISTFAMIVHWVGMEQAKDHFSIACRASEENLVTQQPHFLIRMVVKIVL